MTAALVEECHVNLVPTYIQNFRKALDSTRSSEKKFCLFAFAWIGFAGNAKEMEIPYMQWSICASVLKLMCVQKCKTQQSGMPCS